MGMHDHFAPLGLWSFVSQVPRALPWAFTLCAFGTERFARNWRRVNSGATPASIAGRPVNNLLARWTGREWIFWDHPDSLLLRSPGPAHAFVPAGAARTQRGGHHELFMAQSAVPSISCCFPQDRSRLRREDRELVSDWRVSPLNLSRRNSRKPCMHLQGKRCTASHRRFESSHVSPSEFTHDLAILHRCQPLKRLCVDIL